MSLGKTPNSHLFPEDGKSWSIHSIIQLLRGLPKRLVSVPPISESWLDQVYSSCSEAAEDKREQSSLLWGTADRGWYSSVAFIWEKRKEWRMCPMLWIFRMLPDKLVSVFPAGALMGPGLANQESWGPPTIKESWVAAPQKLQDRT